jgi:hypothetical protein
MPGPGARSDGSPSHERAEHFLTGPAVDRLYDAVNPFDETDMPTQIALLREQLARHIAQRGSDDPRVEHLRWQIASLERQARWREDAAGMFGAPQRPIGAPPSGTGG